MRRLLFPCTLLLPACVTMPPVGSPLTGQWGGQQVALALSPGGGTLEYDCASGTIGGQVIARQDGSFAAQGLHIRGHGGPEVQGHVAPRYRVRYSGTVRGKVMTLQGRLENGELLGPFTLRQGAKAILHRCL